MASTVAEIFVRLKADDKHHSAGIRKAKRDLDRYARSVRSIATVSRFAFQTIVASSGAAAISIAALGSAAAIASSVMVTAFSAAAMGIIGLAAIGQRESDSLGKAFKETGTAWQEMLQRVSGGEGMLGGMHKEFHDLAKALKGMAEDLEPTFQRMMDNLVPLFSDFVDGSVKMLSQWTRDFTSNMQTLSPLFQDFANMLPTITSSVTRFFDSITSSAAMAREGLTAGFQAFWERLLPSLGRFLASMNTLGAEAFPAVMEGLSRLIDQFTEMANTLARNEGIFANTFLGLVDGINFILDGVEEMMVALGPGMGDVLRALGSAVGSLAPGLIVLGQAIESMARAGAFDLLATGLGILARVVGEVIMAFEPIIRAFNDDLMPVISDMVSTLLPPFVNLISNLASAAAPLVGIFAQFLAALTPVADTFIRAFTPILIRLVQELLPPLAMLMEGVARAMSEMPIDMLAMSFGNLLLAALPLVSYLAEITAMFISGLAPILPVIILSINGLALGIGALGKVIAGFVIGAIDDVLRFAQAWEELFNKFSPIKKDFTSGLEGIMQSTRRFQEANDQSIQHVLRNNQQMVDAWLQGNLTVSNSSAATSGSIWDAANATVAATQAATRGMYDYANGTEDANERVAGSMLDTNVAVISSMNGLRDSMNAVAPEVRRALSHEFENARRDIVVSMNQAERDTLAHMQSMNSGIDTEAAKIAPRFRDHGREAIGALGGAFETHGPEAVDTATAVRVNIENTLKDHDAIFIGTDLAKGLAQGITIGTQYAEAAARNLVNRAEAAARDASKTRSPSLVWAKIGEDLTAGLGWGIRSGESHVVKTVTGLVNKLTESIRIRTHGAGIVGGQDIAKIFKVLVSAPSNLRLAAAGARELYNNMLAANEQMAQDKARRKLVEDLAEARKEGEGIARALEALQEFDAKIAMDAEIKRIESVLEKADNKASLQFEFADTATQIGMLNELLAATEMWTDEWTSLYRERHAKLEEVAAGEQAILEDMIATRDDLEQDLASLVENYNSERERLQQSHADEVGRIKKQMASLEERYNKDVIRENERFLKETAQFAQKYEDLLTGRDEAIRAALEARKKTLVDAFTIGQDINIADAMNPTNLAANIKKGTDHLGTWADALDKLRAQGLDEGLIEALGLDDPRNIQQAVNLADATQAELVRLNELYADRMKVIGRRVEEERTNSETTLYRDLLGIQGQYLMDKASLDTEWEIAQAAHNQNLLSLQAEFNREMNVLRSDLLTANHEFMAAMTALDEKFRDDRQALLDQIVSITDQIVEQAKRAAAAAAAVAASAGAVSSNTGTGNGSGSGGGTVGSSGPSMTDIANSLGYSVGNVMNTEDYLKIKDALGIKVGHVLDPEDKTKIESALRRQAGLYDSGGLLMPGLSLLNNETGKPEYIFTDAQMQKMAGNSGPVTILVELDGRQIAKGTAPHLTDLIRLKTGTKL